MPLDLSHCECLTVRLSALGDAILTTGVLRHWHQTRGLRFHVLTRPALAPIFAGHPAVSSIISVDSPELRLAAWWRRCRALAATHGHMPCIDLHGTLRTRLLRLLWPGPCAVYPKFSLTRRLFMQTRHPALSARLRRLNVPQRYSLALDHITPDRDLLRPTLYLEPAERIAARTLLDSLGLTRPLAVHPYATHPAKSPQHAVWREMIASLEAEGREILILGRHAAPLLPGSPRDLTNNTDLRLTAAVLECCRGLVTGDSGPMHLATAVGTPVIALFGPTTPEWGFYPSGPHDIIHQISCPDAPCSLHGQTTCSRGHACMETLNASLLTSLVQQLPG